MKNNVANFANESKSVQRKNTKRTRVGKNSTVALEVVLVRSFEDDELFIAPISILKSSDLYVRATCSDIEEYFAYHYEGEYQLQMIERLYALSEAMGFSAVEHWFIGTIAPHDSANMFIVA